MNQLRKLLQTIFLLPYLRIRGLIMELCLNHAIYGTSPIQTYHCIEHNCSKEWVKVSESIFEFSHFIVRVLIR